MYVTTKFVLILGVNLAHLRILKIACNKTKATLVNVIRRQYKTRTVWNTKHSGDSSADWRWVWEKIKASEPESFKSNSVTRFSDSIGRGNAPTYTEVVKCSIVVAPELGAVGNCVNRKMIKVVQGNAPA